MARTMLTRPNKEPKLKSPKARRPKKKKRRRIIKNNAKSQVVILLQLKVMPLRPQPLRNIRNSVAMPKDLEKTSLRSLAITVILRQKIDYSLSNLYISDY